MLNLWFERVAKKQLKGYAKLIVYADDFVVCFEDKESAGQFSEMLKQRLAKFGLKIAEDKSRVIEFGRAVWEKAGREGGKAATFDFLGFTHFCDVTRKGKFKIGRRTSSKKFRQKMAAMNEWLKGVRNLVKREVWWEVLKMKLTGHYRYYGIGGNMRALQRFYHLIVRLAYKWLNRRSQRKSYTLETYRQYLAVSLPKPRIYHPYALLSN